MAADESYLELFENDDDYLKDEIVSLQALIRGKLIRQQMKEIQYLYEGIVLDIDGKDVEVVWSNSHHVSRPTIKKAKKDKLKTKHQEKLKGKNQTGSPHLQEPRDENDKLCPDILGDGNQLSNSPRSERNALACKDMEEKSPYSSNDDQNVSSGVSHERPHSVSAEVQTDTLPILDQFWQVSNDQMTSRNGIRSNHDEFYRLNPAQGLGYPCYASPTEETQEKEILMKKEIRQKSTENTGNEIITELNKQRDDDSLVMEKISIHSDQVSADGVKDNAIRKKHSGVVESDKESDEPGLEEFFAPNVKDNEAKRKQSMEQKRDMGETEKSAVKEVKEKDDIGIPKDKEKLLELKNTMAMELLWVQQAINSRKHYLRLKQEMQ